MLAVPAKMAIATFCCASRFGEQAVAAVLTVFGLRCMSLARLMFQRYCLEQAHGAGAEIQGNMEEALDFIP
jgi:hypothetical protein